MPTYNLFGWQKPCYLLQEGYADTYKELIESTAWANYGQASGNPKCADCMVHSGYEASAANHTFTSFGGLWGTLKAMLFNTYANPAAQKQLAAIAAEKTAGKRTTLPILPTSAA